jgi:TetR/AcrR family transcriptional regulator, mexJK operon transcriptional repressor
MADVLAGRTGGSGRPAGGSQPGMQPRSGPGRPHGGSEFGMPARTGPGRPPGGSQQKKAAIVRAALRLFQRDGFARTSVDAIADEAGVSKRTIYNHYGDKASLFLSVISETFDTMANVVSDLIERYLADVAEDQVEENIVAFATEVALVAAQSSERSSLIRLMMAEAPHFPELWRGQMRPQAVTAQIGRQLAVLSDRGLLDIPDPGEAANHLFALTMGQMNNRSLFGIVPLSDDEVIRLAASGARAFLRAYRSGGR